MGTLLTRSGLLFNILNNGIGFFFSYVIRFTILASDLSCNKHLD
jgi:hypothetical protein